MRTPVIYESYHIGRPPMLFGDQVMLKEVFDNHKDFDLTIGFGQPEEGAIVTLPLHHNEDYLDYLNADLSRLKWVLLILTANEFGSDAYKEIKHPNMKLWLQTPKMSDKADRFLPLGYPSNTKYEKRAKKNDWFFSGQVTNQRRVECVEQLKKMDGGILRQTKGFGQGYDPLKYLQLTSKSRVIPCPGGPATPDTYRVYEAMELGCIPIVDKHSGAGNYQGNYWEKVFGTVPFTVVDEWTYLDRQIRGELAQFESRSKTIEAWWSAYKDGLLGWLLDDVKELRAKA